MLIYYWGCWGLSPSHAPKPPPPPLSLSLSLSLHTILISSNTPLPPSLSPFLHCVCRLSPFFSLSIFSPRRGKNEEAAKGKKRGFSLLFLGPLIVDPSVFLCLSPVLLSFGMYSSFDHFSFKISLVFSPFFCWFFFGW